MAAAAPEEKIQEEAKCPICLEYFTDPVSAECGHNFCCACIIQFCDTGEGEYGRVECPLCRANIQEETLRPNWDLARVTECVKTLNIKQREENLCPKHNKSLDLFCEEDRKALCVVCERSLDHAGHKVLLLEEAAEKYQGQMQTQLETLCREREELLRRKEAEEKVIQECQDKAEEERKMIMAGFQHLYEFLIDQEHASLARLDKQHRKVLKNQEEIISGLQGGISRLDALIQEMEERCQQEAREFLQDFQSISSRYEECRFLQPEEISPHLEATPDFWSSQSVTLQKCLWEFKDQLASDLEKVWDACWVKILKKNHTMVDVTLDPDTAHPCLVLSEDWRSVRKEDIEQSLPITPKRFDCWGCVLGCERFTAGKHCWVVEVEEGHGSSSCAVGVARESVRRKGWIKLSPVEGIWAVVRDRGKFWALNSPRTLVAFSEVPRRILVCLDYAGGQVMFVSADTGAEIFTFQSALFKGERICPWFMVENGSAQLHLRP
uniref:Uncharacterized protein n=1 Tax=Apteryx owenii TaxID=8824 RepID=A0A8B9SDT3_APTOW